MAEVAQPVEVPETLKSSIEPAITIEAASGTVVETAAAEGKVDLTDKPKLGEPEAFFPANPAAVDHLAKNKPVKELKSGDRTASGGLLRSISDVITDLHKKHVERKRVSAAETTVDWKLTTSSPSMNVHLQSCRCSCTSSELGVCRSTTVLFPTL